MVLALRREAELRYTFWTGAPRSPGCPHHEEYKTVPLSRDSYEYTSSATAQAIIAPRVVLTSATKRGPHEIKSPRP
jgi:hypothetical protein